MRIADGVFGALFALLGAYMIYTASGFPSFPGQPYGASLLPTLLGIAFIVCGIGLGLRHARARRTAASTGPLVALTPALRDPRGAVSGALAVALVLTQILFGDAIGFIPVSLAGLIVIFLWFRLPAWQAVIFAAVGTALCWWLFSVLLKVPLPRGILDGVL